MNEMPFLASFSRPSSYPGIDWNYVDSCDPVMIHETQDFKSIQSFISSFMNSKLIESDKTVLSHPTAFKLVQLLQITVQYMYNCQQQQNSEIDKLEDEKETYKQKAKLLVKQQNRSAALLRDAYQDFEKCPVCAKRFKAMKYVDQHMKTKHKEHLLAWKSLRINNPIDPSKQVKELQDEIIFLKELINKQNSQFMQSVQNFNAQLEAQKRDFKRKRKVVPTMEYIDSNRQFSNENLDMKILDPNKFRREDGVTYPQVITEKDQLSKFKQNVVHIENRDLKDEDSEDYKGIEDAEWWIENNAEKASNRIHLGLGANYVTPKQVEGILRYDNPTYQHFYNAAKNQLENDFPMPDKQTKKKGKPKKNNIFNSGNTSSSSKKKTDSSLAFTPSSRPVGNQPVAVTNSSSYNTNESIGERQNSDSAGEVRNDLRSDSSFENL